MATKLIISERQLELLATHIKENDSHQSLVRRVAADLDLNYEPTVGTYKKGGEYHEEKMVLNKVNKEQMTVASLYDYMKYKYELGDDFLKQIIDDWYKGNLDKSGQLSKNVSMA